MTSRDMIFSPEFEMTSDLNLEPVVVDRRCGLALNIDHALYDAIADLDSIEYETEIDSDKGTLQLEMIKDILASLDLYFNFTYSFRFNSYYIGNGKDKKKFVLERYDDVLDAWVLASPYFNFTYEESKI